MRGRDAGATSRALGGNASVTSVGDVAVPVAERRVERLHAHGDEREDPWYWLRNRDDPSVIEHLKAENRYTDSVLAHLEELRATLYEEIRGRVPESDETAPVRSGAFEYYVRTVEGHDYPLLCRRPLSRDAGAAGEEEVLLDANVEAEGAEFFSLGSTEVSPDHRFLAYCVDTSGTERHSLRVRDLATGLDLADRVDDVYYGLAWSDDSSYLFFVRPDDAMRPYRVLRHRIGSDASEDSIVVEERDERFFVTVRRTRSGRFVLMESDSKTSSEVQFIPSDDPLAEPRVIAPRRADVEYSVDHQHSPELDRFVIVCNDTGADFRVVTAPTSRHEPAHWTELVPHRTGVRVEHVDAFADFVVISERTDATTRLRVLGDQIAFVVDQPEPVHSVSLGTNREPATDTVRFEYSSPTTAPESIDLCTKDGSRTLVKRRAVLGDYDPSTLASERLWATAADGTRIPISLVRWRGDTGPAPLLLYGYGAYEVSADPFFSDTRLSLLERGVAFAIAHVRGGGEMGRPWYEAGRLSAKRNTFTDFVACAQQLVDQDVTEPGRMVARGRSAGGLLMGAVANLRPDLFSGIVAEVPFVDALTTMQDPSLPLTITEWEEWGNPAADADMYGYMRSYSPYDNVVEQPYPAILATCGLNDSRVQYWEPAKWVQRLREHTTSDAPILLRCEFGAGHSGPSGRYDAWREEAFVLAFVLDRLGLAPSSSR